MNFSRLFYYFSSIPTLLLGIKNWPEMVRLFLGLPGSRPFIVRLRNGSRFLVRTPMDVWILKETCLDRQYQNASLEIEDAWAIIDIGAGLGDFAICVAREHSHSTVYAYEPFPESFTLLQENLRLNQVQNVKPFPYAVGAQAGSTLLHLVSPEAVQHTTISRDAQSDSNVQVQRITLEQVFTEHQLSRCDYLKMDCEGAEYDILFSVGAETLGKIQHVCLEYHDGMTQFSHTDLVAFLEEHNFRVRLTPNPVHANLGYLYAANLTRTA